MQRQSYYIDVVYKCGMPKNTETLQEVLKQFFMLNFKGEVRNFEVNPEIAPKEIVFGPGACGDEDM